MPARFVDYLLLLLIFALALVPFSCGSDDSSESEDDEPDIECSYDVDCGVGYVCLSGKCFKTCVAIADCGAGQLCQNNICRADPNYVGPDGDLTDGDQTDGDTSDGDITDADVIDGDTSDGDISDGDTSDGDAPCEDGTTWCFAKALHFCDGGEWEPIDCTVICRQDGLVHTDCGPVDVGGNTIPYCICTGPTDGDVTDGDGTDGDVTDGDVTDGDSNDCDMLCTGRCGMFYDCYCGDCGSGQICNDINFCVTDCEALCNGRCGGFSGCDCGVCPEGERCDSTNVCLPDYDCTTDSQCGQDTCDPWSDCNYSDVCDESSQKTRTCRRPVCPNHVCEIQTRQETESCNRSTYGIPCGDDICNSNGQCDCSGEECGTSGFEHFQCVKQKCSNSSCREMENYNNDVPCTCNPNGQTCDFETGPNSGLCNSSGNCVWNNETWLDSSTGLTWTVWPVGKARRIDAVAACPAIGAGWHLPELTELRSIIAGCAATETGGACPATTSCSTCFDAVDCYGCAEDAGPDNGCYRKSMLNGDCGIFWSNTDKGVSGNIWVLKAYLGRIAYLSPSNQLLFYCVKN